jgi:hypothetical protein
VIGTPVFRIGLLLLLLLLAGCEKHRLDEQVKELCAKDGGVKVYETVTLPKDVFTEYGDLKFYRATQGENALGPEYVFVTEVTEIKSGNPELKRIAFRIVRRSDRVTLGESVSYARGGGDMPGPWHSSTFQCPDKDVGEGFLMRGVFRPQS